ncbi:MAG: ABC transporter permease [Alphaproteobacteria bacterium]
MNYLLAHPDVVLALAGQHLILVACAVGVAAAVGIPTGIAIRRVAVLEVPTLVAAGLLYLIPSLALFAFLIPVFGLGRVSAMVALVLYSLLVIIRNTATGLKAVSPAAVEAAIGVGMSANARLWLVELPLALPVVVGGLRVATVMGVGIATIAAYIGAGGLGTLVFRGIATADNDLIVAGAAPIAAIALAADAALRAAERSIRA